MNDLQLIEEIIRRQGTECIVPGCHDPWVDRAHVEPSGMGGRPSLAGAENRVGLCRPHHDIFDGREMYGRQRLFRILMKFLADRTAEDRKTVHA